MAEKVQQTPDSLRETARRFTPRWLSEGLLTGLDVDVDPSPGNILVRPEYKETGRVIFQQIFEYASAIEDTNPQKAFGLRSEAFLSLLELEKEQANRATNPEIPFFTLTLASEMVLEFIQNSGSSAFYHKAVTDTLHQAYKGAQEELETNGSEDFQNFLKTLGRYYPGTFDFLLAKSILNMNRGDPSLNASLLLRELAVGSTFPRLLDQAKAFSPRPLLTIDELERHLERMPKAEEPVDLARLSTQVASLTSEVDLYSFKADNLPYHKKTPDELWIDIVRTTQSIAATFRFWEQGKQITAELKLIWGEEEKYLQVSDLPDNLKPETAKRLVVLIAEGVNRQFEHQDKEEKSRNNLTSLRISPHDTNQSLLDRQQRKANYPMLIQQAQKEQKQAAKRNGKRSPIEEYQAEANSEIEVPKKVIDHLSLEGIEDFLKEENIHAIKGEDILKKLNHALKMASTTVELFGIKIEHNDLRLPNHGWIDLRELKWRVSGANALRVYIQEIGEGHFLLRGIQLKKSDDKQDAYIEKIIGRIKKDWYASHERH